MWNAECGMRNFIWVFLIMMLGGRLFAQSPLIYEHTYPMIQQEDPRIRQLMEEVSKDSLEATIEHLQSYYTRRWDSQMVYEVQDWLRDT